MQRDNEDDQRDCPTAYDCRDRLPGLSSWTGEDLLKELPIWHRGQFELGQVYFDLDNPARGAFAATGDEGIITDHPYVSRAQASERAWAHFVTWRQPISFRRTRPCGAPFRISATAASATPRATSPAPARRHHPGLSASATGTGRGEAGVGRPRPRT
jgi:hypothetical protein